MLFATRGAGVAVAFVRHRVGRLVGGSLLRLPRRPPQTSLHGLGTWAWHFRVVCLVWALQGSSPCRARCPGAPPSACTA